MRRIAASSVACAAACSAARAARGSLSAGFTAAGPAAGTERYDRCIEVVVVGIFPGRIAHHVPVAEGSRPGALRTERTS